MTHKLGNPTGGTIRKSDNYGAGHYGASRGKRKHAGLDVRANPGQVVRSPVHGLVLRESRPYGDGGLYDCGLLIEGTGEHQGLKVTLFYVKGDDGIVGRVVAPGDQIGTAMSLQTKYPGITDHVHIAIREGTDVVDPEPLIFPSRTYEQA